VPELKQNQHDAHKSAVAVSLQTYVRGSGLVCNGGQNADMAVERKSAPPDSLLRCGFAVDVPHRIVVLSSKLSFTVSRKDSIGLETQLFDNLNV
jgi:hypothetical protein